MARMKAEVAAALLLPLLLASCASINRTPYPTTWPQQGDVGEGCQHISGRFYNAAEGKSYEHPQGHQLLGMTLFPYDVRLQQVESIRVWFDASDGLRVSGYNDADAMLIERVYAPGNAYVRCQDGMLLISPDKKPGSSPAPDNPVLGHSSNVLTLWMTADGSLILHEVASATGLAFLIIPAHAESEQWYLFRPYAPNAR